MFDGVLDHHLVFDGVTKWYEAITVVRKGLALVESIKTMSMEDVSTGVLEKK